MLRGDFSNAEDKDKRSFVGVSNRNVVPIAVHNANIREAV